MPIDNADVADILNQVADLLEIKGANQFRVRAYRKAAQTISGLPQSVSYLVENKEDLTTLPGIGKDLAQKIKKIVKTGNLPQLEKLKKKIPGKLSELMNINKLGPKKVKALYDELNIENIDDLKKAAEDKKIRKLEGFGKKTEESILKGLEQLKQHKGRYKLSEAEQIANPLVNYIKNIKGVKKVTVAGSFRRRKETVGDLDILVTCKKSSPLMDKFVKYEDVKKVMSKGSTKSTVMLRKNMQVDLRKIAQVSYGAALYYFTGSKEHSVEVRKIAQKKKYKLNEYGLFKNDNRVAGKTEKEVFNKLGLAYIPPEMRENTGEIEVAKKDKLPELITLDDVRGDLHVHSKHTDGKYSIRDMAKAAEDRGYEYIALTDHSKHVTVAQGLNVKRLKKEIKEIDTLNNKLDKIYILKGIEVDILEDGTLDLPDEVLKELDVVVCSVHYKFDLPRKKQTERVIRAMDNKYFNILGHPSGRLLNERQPYDIDIERIIEAAKDKGCFIELNAHPDRLDLFDYYCKFAKEKAVKIAISTDAHSKTDYDFIRFGIGTARRGWLEADDVLNAYSRTKLLKLLKRS